MSKRIFFNLRDTYFQLLENLKKRSNASSKNVPILNNSYENASNTDRVLFKFLDTKHL